MNRAARRAKFASRADAAGMLSFLFAATGRRRDEAAKAKLLACIDVFSETSNALGAATG